MTVSGPDRVGVGAELFAALKSLEARGIAITDVAQITIRGALVLCAEVSSRNSVDRAVVEEALGQRDIVSKGITATVEEVTPSDANEGRRLLVTFLAPRIGATQLQSVFGAIAASGSTCERIVHLASYPVDCYELVVRSSDHDSLRAVLVDVAGAIRRRNGIGSAGNRWSL